MTLPGVVFSAQAPNPRGANSAGRTMYDSDTSASVRRSATSVIARTANTNNRSGTAARSTVSRAGTVRSARKTENVVLDKSNISRAASNKSSLVRSATAQNNKKVSNAGVSRAASSRATAVFNDISKIGGGYASCRDAYATCMDQFCANANDAYRRCYCSDKFKEFRDTADSLDAALDMLAEFQDNNLNAVDKTAAEVNAMYSASAGEAAIKRDTSASQKLLDSIGEVLSGKKKTNNQTSLTSLGVLDLTGFSSGSDDIWGADTSSLFGSKKDTDFASMEGSELYTNAVKQCAEVISESCKSDAIFNMAKSAYSIMITQDCNLYQKNIDAKKASIEDTVRTAEKYLREARLEEYRAHNSQDVNECMNRVENAMRQPTACGVNYEKCLDYTGLYVNSVTGEPIYSKALFDLNNLIKLDGSADVVGANPDFNKFLEDKKVFANTALDTCRDLADTVWSEYKRMAIIQISQAQDEKIQEVKDSCVTTMKECYDTQTGALNDFAGTTGTTVGSISAIAAHDMCKDKVLACVALYGDVDGCKYDDETKKLQAVSDKQCGLTSLLSFVNTVDSVKVAEGCEASLKEFAQDMCSPAAGDTAHEYPWGCRLATKSELETALNERAKYFCGSVDGGSSEAGLDTSLNTGIINYENVINTIIDDIVESVDYSLGEECRGYDGIWMDNKSVNNNMFSNENLLTVFYTKAFNGEKNTNYGYCVENTIMTQCLSQNTEDKQYATYDAATMTCSFTEAWYKNKCTEIGGYYTEDSVCYVPNK